MPPQRRLEEHSPLLSWFIPGDKRLLLLPLPFLSQESLLGGASGEVLLRNLNTSEEET